MVVAYTKLHDALVWGVCRGGMVIKVPQIAKLEFPRDVFFRGTYDDTGGAVYPGRHLGSGEIFHQGKFY